MKSERIAEQIAQVDRDLAEIDEQVEVGELDEATAERLRVSYRSERSGLEKQLAELDESEAADDSVIRVNDAAAPRSKSRAIIGTILVGAAALVIAVIAVVSLQEQTPASDVTDGIATDVLEGQVAGGGSGSGMSSVSAAEMEAVVAENPEVIGMRMALAELYLEEGNTSKALEHYMIILEQEPENTEALVRVGWLTSIADEPALAEPFFEKALSIDPDFPQAYWFLANVRFDMGNKAGAIEPLEALLAFAEIPDEVRTEATAMLEEARS